LVLLYDFDGASLLTFKINQETVEVTNYSIDGTSITINSTFLDTLSLGFDHEIEVSTLGGSATLFFIVNDTPVILDKTDFIKLPGEAISHENFSVLAQNQIGSLDYLIETEATYTSFTDFGDGTFSFTPASVFVGSIYFTLTVTDEYGATASKDIELVYKTVNPIIYDSQGEKIINKDTLSEDLVMTVDTFGTESSSLYFEMTDVLLDDVSIGLENIIFKTDGDPRYFSVKQAYLISLPVGTYTFTLTTEAGRADFIVNVYASLDTSVSNKNFDKHDPQAVSFVMTGLPLVCNNVKYASVIINSENYQFSEGTITFTSSYLATFGYGEQVFVFNNGYGDTELTVTVLDSRVPIITSTGMTYFGGTEQDLEIAFNLYDESYTSLKFDALDVDTDNYSFVSGVLTINGDYLEIIASGETSLDFILATTDGNVSFQVIVEPEVILPIATQITGDFQIDFLSDVTFQIDFGGNTFSAIKYDGTNLTEDEDYTYNSTTKQITFLDSFLIRIFDSVHTTYSFDLITAEANNIVMQIDFEAGLNKVVNGGFETGDLFGWTTYGLWKDEAGLISFINERVVLTEYYGSTNTNPYNKDGLYHFGVYAEPYDNTNKDINQERMGMLRSSNFTLAGSGYISFKLGAGKSSGTAYVSVRLASTNEEVARFANRNFGNTSISGTANAEAYMFQYYYDLSEYLGEELYFLVVDQASHEWSVLAFDSFDTYYLEAPTVSANQEAYDILPNIYGAGSATNTIPNGALTSNLDYWENPNSVFTIANGGAISSVGGDPALGVLRSPAFTIDGANVYLRFEFAGSIAYDKQVFVIVKEVGTNIEVLRLTRRADLSSLSPSGDFQAHWFDLSGLSTEKEYYLEVVDNINRSWGVALIRNVQLLSTGYGSANEVAINTFYGLAYVDQEDGSNRIPVSDLSPVSFSNTDFVITTLGEDASDEVRINYQSSVENTIVEYTLASDFLFENSTKILVIGNSFSTDINVVGGITYGFDSRYVSSVSVSGLLAGTEYIYRIRDGFNKSPVYDFKTAGIDSQFRFLYMTDTQAETNLQAMITRDLVQDAYEVYDDYSFSLMTGDLVETAARELYWEWFYEALNNQLPLVTVPGNHDYRDYTFNIVTPDYYNSFFNNPLNGPVEYLNTSYYFVYENTLFIMIDVVTGDNLSSQQAWLLDVVENNPTTFIIVSTHSVLMGHITIVMLNR